MINEIPILVFDDSVKERVIKSLGFSRNEDSKLVDENDKVVTTQEFESIKESEFGGVLKSSKIPIKKEESELVKYFISCNN
ncbi:hypothetical protein CMI42_03955 [Candidatus Pacearchaeota archaeon]|nr:hypothetical protein [Candidatus Pacearchaeota archaeon]